LFRAPGRPGSQCRGRGHQRLPDAACGPSCPSGRSQRLPLMGPRSVQRPRGVRRGFVGRSAGWLLAPAGATGMGSSGCWSARGISARGEC